MSVPIFPGHSNYDHLHTWEEDNFRLELWDTLRAHARYPQKSVLAYQLYDGDALIFQGEDFCSSPLHTIHSDATVAALLNFLSLRPGDTDPDYFDDYTPEQMEWCQGGRGEYLGILAMELEEVSRQAD